MYKLVRVPTGVQETKDFGAESQCGMYGPVLGGRDEVSQRLKESSIETDCTGVYHVLAWDCSSLFPIPAAGMRELLDMFDE